LHQLDLFVEELKNEFYYGKRIRIAKEYKNINYKVNCMTEKGEGKRKV
jgi:hypothetical protein